MFYVAPLQIQSQSLSFAEWVALLTLCLAPLIAHILAGAPQPSLLASSKPKWHDRVCILNPTSILCRYAAIVDRRIRARQWGPVDAAAANAVFWNQHGWDGSEEMVMRALPYCTLLPDHGTVELLSTEMLKTAIVTMQGLQALVSLVGGVTGTVLFNQYFGLDGIFGPLSVMGLLRLYAAPWLTDDYMYSGRALAGAHAVAYGPVANNTSATDVPRHSIDSLNQPPDIKESVDSRYRPVSFWPSQCFRALYFSSLIGCWFLAMWWTFIRPILRPRGTPLTSSSFFAGVFYVFGLGSTAIIYFCYYIWGNARSTILPCASDIWYKAYTIVLTTFMGVVLLLSALETYKAACGSYTSLPARCSDLVCVATGGEVPATVARCY
ncbi:hypothetical protein JX265_011779 [Neoarthrinium moseri]|uniref:Uncharacterized protein n=1 Tax=Neoarthrinium moseri TaxID=1658444 RepID=A0A9P9WBI2_9PEZI|nr:hypothetical protein JX265_011779 [Neoarthrinium moseri]